MSDAALERFKSERDRRHDELDALATTEADVGLRSFAPTMDEDEGRRPLGGSVRYACSPPCASSWIVIDVTNS